MFKKIIIILILISLIPTVSAGLTKLEIPYKIDFMGKGEFFLDWEGGRTETYHVNDTHQPEDKEIKMVVYKDLNDTVICAEQYDAFQNLTNKMAGVMEVCQALADNNNVSLALELSDTKYSNGLQNNKLTVCNGNLIKANEKAALYESCEVSKNSFKSKFENCDANLSNTSKNNKSLPLIVGVVVAVICWFVWGRKKDQPSEFQDEGFDNY